MIDDKDYSLQEWAEELAYNRNHDEWNDERIEKTHWQDTGCGLGVVVPFQELVLYLAVKYLECKNNEFIIEPPYPITPPFEKMIIKNLEKLIAGKGYYQTKDNPDSFRVMGLESKFSDAMKPIMDLTHNPFDDISDTEQKEYVKRGIRGYLGIYADSFPFGSNYEVRTYQEAKLIYEQINTIKQALKTAGANKEDITKKSSNNHKGYKALTVTQLKKNIKESLQEKLHLRSFSKDRKSRIISRAIELILK